MIPRVLIIDDETDWQEIFEYVFIDDGWEADSAADISTAKELLGTHDYRLIILDIFLRPDQAPINYQSFLTFIVRTYPDVVVVTATGKQLAPDEAFALSRLGASYFIYKPRFHIDEIRRIARSTLEPAAIEAHSSRELDQRLERIEELIVNGFAGLNSSVGEVTSLTRAILKLASADVTDCPRLFTLEETTGVRISSAAKTNYLLTLWCEYPGGAHPWEAATYKFGLPRNWLRTVAPYGLLVSRILSMVVPVAAGISGVVLSSEDMKRVQDQLELMKEIAAQLPKTKIPAATSSTTVDRLTPEEGAGLRALRALLLSKDKVGTFGDLRKIGTEHGEIIWVCPRHEENYRK